MLGCSGSAVNVDGFVDYCLWAAASPYVDFVKIESLENAMGAESKTLVKLAIAGAISAIVIDHFVKPSINSALNFKQ